MYELTEVPPVIVELKGGLGNQMFEAAVGSSIAERHDSPLIFDVSALARDRQRKFELHVFQAFASTPLIGRNVLESKDTFLRHQVPLPAFLTRTNRHIFEESSFAFDPDVFKANPPIRLRGYFQSWRYFEDLDETRTLFLTRSESFTRRVREMVGTEYISMHVRRGDYLNPLVRRKHGLLSPSYFSRAIDLLRNGLCLHLPVVLFTEHSSELPLEISTLGDFLVESRPDRHPSMDMTAMAAGKAIVMSNSSFSWWAAFLADQRNVPVVAPRPWFTLGDVSASDLIFPHWISLGNE